MATPLILPPALTFEEVRAKQRRDAQLWAELADRIDVMIEAKRTERADVRRAA